MRSWQPFPHLYQPLESKEECSIYNEENDGIEEVAPKRSTTSSSWYSRCSLSRQPVRRWIIIVMILAGGASILFSATRFTMVKQSSHAVLMDSSTGNASVCGARREWRTLTPSEQQHYISSVRCLLNHPSIFRLHAKKGSTLYEDFPWVHSHSGYYTHNSAAFLPWHRYFLHVYEAALRQKCGFRGEGLVYWDWTLDWKDLTQSPVFSTKNGFGGDGEKGGEVVIGKTGRCVTDGPFNDIVAKYYDTDFKPHCLSRGFVVLDTGVLGKINGTSLRPSSINAVLALDTYEDFVKSLETLVHDTIPMGIGGDFQTFTAPYDPLFYLHHVMLDRLWWIWQHRAWEKRSTEYRGLKARFSNEPASLEDIMDYQGLASTVRVKDVMDAEENLLCYEYV